MDESVGPVVRPKGLVYLGDGLVALVARLYWSWLLAPCMATEETIMAVYNGSRLVCTARVTGYALDARGYNGILWVLARPPLVFAPLTRVENVEVKRGLVVAVLDARTCRLYRVVLPHAPMRALLLVTPNEAAYLAASYWGKEGPVTILTRLVFNGSSLVASGGARLEGVLPVNWLSLTLYKGFLLAVLEEPRGVRLYTVDPSSLEVRAELFIPRPREAVHAVKLIGGRLYIVTFRRMDPLFVVDVGGPVHPRLLGWRKGPGFDQILEPLGDGLVVGLGYKRSLLRLTVYRVAANYSLVPVDKRLFRAWGRALLAPWGYSLFTSSGELVAYPVVEGGSERVLVARIAANGTILDAKMLDGRRALVYNDTLVVVGRDSVTLYSLEGLREIASVPLTPG